MSFVFCINIVLGNVSLRYIPVSFMQTIKSFTPATTGNCVLFVFDGFHSKYEISHCLYLKYMHMTVILQWLVWRKVFERRIWVSLVPIVGGILLTSITELSFNVLGF